RGATPVESAILNGDSETGVCIQKMAFKLDTGAILGVEKMTISPDITAPELRIKLNEKAATMLPQIIKKYLADKITPIPQDEHLASHCKKIKKEDGLIDAHDTSIENYRKFRAYAAWPRTYFFATPKNDPSKKIRVIVSSAEFKENHFIITKVIPESKKEMPFSQFIDFYDLENLSKSF
ncbi:MAG TPA: formyltransferase family protein, partial [Candidatus Paceibacterota bacterium]|nr:formyltransferase family protein [Candidatus Paceibacterota bacterium]